MDDQFMNLSSTSELEDKASVKVVYIPFETTSSNPLTRDASPTIPSTLSDSSTTIPGTSSASSSSYELHIKAQVCVLFNLIYFVPIHKHHVFCFNTFVQAQGGTKY